jgi:endonuclease/exonuclease/phosphatase family metal-dependent hydrolase
MFPPRSRPLIWLVIALVVLVGCVQCFTAATHHESSAASAPADGYLFCFWNAENLFDDQDDHRHTEADKEYDSWFAHNPAALHAKLDHLSEALIALNGDRGPDILAVAEVESGRAAELLQKALNDRLPDASLHYQHLLMKEVAGGRHIAPAILTRLPVRKDKTQLHGHALRILEGHIQVNGHDLVVIASHWTSRLPQRHNARTTHGEDGRDKYGDQIYGVFKGMYLSNPNVDFLVCGDCNDTPQDDSIVKHLHAVGDPEAVRSAPPSEPLLLDLFARKDPNNGYGTYYHEGHWTIFDQFAVSAGLLDDEGWKCAVETVETVNNLVRPRSRHGEPWRFGNEKERVSLRERGYSDHFPVTVRLQVAP